MSCKTCEPLPNGSALENLDRYSLQEDQYFFVVECPPGAFCGGVDAVSLVCCDGTQYGVTLPASMSTRIRDQALQAMMTECARRMAACVDAGGGGGGDGGAADGGTSDGEWGMNIDVPTANTPIHLYYSSLQSASAPCPDGTVFTYRVLPGRFVAFTQAMADLRASQLATQLVLAHRLCLSSLNATEWCVDVPFTATLSVSGTHTAHSWSIVSGSLPTGLSLPVGLMPGKQVALSGTPTVSGSYTFKVRATASDNCYMEREYTLDIFAISPATLPDGEAGVDYSAQLSVLAGWTVQSWEISGGSLPAGLNLDAGTGLIAGMPSANGTSNFTVTATATKGTHSIACSKDYAIQIGVQGFCVEDSSTVPRIKNYVDDWTVDPFADPSGWPAWDGIFHPYFAGVYTPGDCSYGNSGQDSIQGKAINFLWLTNGNPGHPGEWVIMISCAGDPGHPGNKIVWAGSKAGGATPVGIYTRDETVLTPQSDARATVEIEEYTV